MSKQGQDNFRERLSKAIRSVGGNRTIITLSVARMGDAIGNSVLFIIIPLYVTRFPSTIFNVSEILNIGILIAVYGFVEAILQPFTGAWSDRLGKRKPFIQIGLLIMAGSILGFAFVNRYLWLLFLRAGQGLGVAITIPASVALISLASPQHVRGGSMGIYNTMRMLGLAIGPPLGTFLLGTFGFDSSFYAATIFILIGAALVHFLVQDKWEKPPKQRPGRLQILDTSVLSAPILSLGLATYSMTTAFSILTTLENQFNARLQQSAFIFSLSFTVFVATQVIFQIPLGRLSDKIGRKPLILVGLLLMIVSTGFLGLISTTMELILLRFGQGLAAAGIAAPSLAGAADLARPDKRAQVLGILTAGFGLGLATGPLLAGLLVGFSFELPFLIASAMCLVAFGAVFIWVKEKPKDTPDQRE